LPVSELSRIIRADQGAARSKTRLAKNRYADLETRLRSLATPLAPPRRGDWLAEHPERGQTFQQYVSANPIRRNHQRTSLYLCLLGDFSTAQAEVLEITREYLGVFFDVPVVVRRHVGMHEIPGRAQRTHPKWGDRQILSGYILDELLRPDRPEDALAYLALTASDLWPGVGWNFVFGEASFDERVGVWSMYRDGDPGRSDAAFRLCLRRTLSTASHETAHILTMEHCIAYACLMNGCNHQRESDSRPLYPCPVCLHKLVWNLQVEPVVYLQRLQRFCDDQELVEEAQWYGAAAESLIG
jgi:archaemetzincin